jgi:hypothetical protein
MQKRNVAACRPRTITQQSTSLLALGRCSCARFKRFSRHYPDELWKSVNDSRRRGSREANSHLYGVRDPAHGRHHGHCAAQLGRPASAPMPAPLNDKLPPLHSTRRCERLVPWASKRGAANIFYRCAATNVGSFRQKPRTGSPGLCITVATPHQARL